MPTDGHLHGILPILDHEPWRQQFSYRHPARIRPPASSCNVAQVTVQRIARQDSVCPDASTQLALIEELFRLRLKPAATNCIEATPLVHQSTANGSSLRLTSAKLT